MLSCKYHQLFKDIGYEFNNIDLLERALTHRSCRGMPNNERLEFLGDAILSMVISEMLFIKFPEAKEGYLSNLRSLLIQSEMLSKLGKKIGLDKLIRAETDLTNCQDRLISDGLEALIAAIYLDSGGLNNIKKVILALYRDIDLGSQSSQEDINNIKSALQERTVKLFGEYPIYELLKEAAKPSANRFTVRLYLKGLNISYIEQGRTIKQAEKKAALKALEYLDHSNG